MNPQTSEQINLPQTGQLNIATGPRVTSGRGSKQTYATPWQFIHALEARFGPIDFDLAASDTNAKAKQWITEEANSLSSVCQWHKLSAANMFLNPPFGVIGPWAQKCLEQSLLGARILLLVPAAVGSNWFRDFVHQRAAVKFLSPRIQFDGADDPYPKDLILAHYSPEPLRAECRYECWRWKP